MLGQKAVDPISGELSPTSGVRLNPETDTVIPVTLSSSTHRKRKPPLGAVATLEEEMAARRSYWYRQRQKERDLTLQEFSLAQRILYGMENVSLRRLEGALDTLSTKAHELDDSAKKEVQRRAEAHHEYSTILPPDVVAVLTEGNTCTILPGGNA